MLDSEGVSLLIRMSDVPVRQKAGEVLLDQMKHSPRVRDSFFPGSPVPAVDPVSKDFWEWLGQVASSLIALSLARCSSHGFGATVNAAAAQAFLDANLKAGNMYLDALGMYNYSLLFPAWCASDGTTFGSFAGGSYGPAARWGTLLAQALSSPAYINQQMAKLNPAVDPGGWFQVLFANFHKVRNLNSSEASAVQQAWAVQLGGRERANPASWTVSERMLSRNYSASTFMDRVQAMVSASVLVPYDVWSSGGALGVPIRTTANATVFGPVVNAWLQGNQGLGGFVNGPSNSNRIV
jgi:hypothetical protein